MIRVKMRQSFNAAHYELPINSLTFQTFGEDHSAS